VLRHNGTEISKGAMSHNSVLCSITDFFVFEHLLYWVYVTIHNTLRIYEGLKWLLLSWFCFLCHGKEWQMFRKVCF